MAGEPEENTIPNEDRQCRQVDEQLCYRMPDEQCHTNSDDKVDEATENIAEDKEEENSDATTDCKDASKDVDECAGVSNEESAAPVVHGAAV